MADDFRRIGDILGGNKREWPPTQPAPGVQFRERPIKTASVLLRKALLRDTITEPVIVDERAYYANLAGRNYREEDDRNCRKCNGAGYVRYERGMSHPLFGQIRPCPRECWKPRPKAEPAPWWDKP